MADLHTVTCPHCGTDFDMSQSEYYALAEQVRGAEFNAEVEAKLKTLQDALEAQWAIERQKLQFDIKSRDDALRASEDALRDKLRAAQERAVMEKNMLCSEHDAKLQAQRAEFDAQVRALEQQVEFYKDFKARQSTKAIGESLELYCEDQFNRIRALAFPQAYFEKDNQVSKTGSKGDYIYRETDETGQELLSIMFEMKNEADSTADKQRHKNADFFKELDKDRREKGCEYAILVTMLESDSEVYNQGIVDVSHRYPKMYVIRPQFFIPVIGFLRNAALNASALRQEIATLRAQNLDVQGFEQRFADFRAGFGRNAELANGHLDAVISDIDKVIEKLTQMKGRLQKASNNVRLAGDKLDGLTVQSLTRGNAYMAAKFSETSEGSKD